MQINVWFDINYLKYYDEFVQKIGKKAKKTKIFNLKKKFVIIKLIRIIYQYVKFETFILKNEKVS